MLVFVIGVCVLDVCVVFGGKLVYLLECDFSLCLLVFDIDVCCFVCVCDIYICIGVGEGV